MADTMTRPTEATRPEVDSERWYDRPFPAAVVLTLFLFAVAQIGDPLGYLSTDVGGKTATLEVMVENPLDVDLGYWAEDLDPDGSLYPMWSTTRVQGKWINATSLPMLVLVAPLYAVGGANLALLGPVLGTVLAAAAARALAQRLGGDRRARRTTFWLVGLASPATVYALDLWEHSLGLALMAWGVVAVLDASERPAARWTPILAGLAFGVAASMRQEALVYGFVAGCLLVGRLGATGRVGDAIGRGTAMVAGALAGLVANVLLEITVIGASLRSGRSAGTAGAAGGDVVARLKEAAITGASPFGTDTAATYLLSAALLALLVAIAVRADGDVDERRPLLVVVCGVYLLVLLDLALGGLRFVPGMIATTPVAALGLWRGWEAGSRRFVTTLAVGALPLIWATQFTGGAGPQWGGRYLLTSGLLLITVAVVTMTTDAARATLRIVAALGAVVTLAGVGWTIERTHAFADTFRALAERPEPVLVFHDSFLAREAGPVVLEERWLAATGPEARAEAVALLETAGIGEVGFVDHADGTDIRELPGWVLVGESEVPFVSGLALRVTTWTAP